MNKTEYDFNKFQITFEDKADFNIEITPSSTLNVLRKTQAKQSFNLKKLNPLSKPLLGKVYYNNNLQFALALPTTVNKFLQYQNFNKFDFEKEYIFN